MTPVFEAPASIADVFADALAHDPDREALVTRRVRWSYRELDDACARASAALVDLGVGPGDRVAAVLPNEADIVAAFHGAMRVGAIWVGVNQALATPEKAFLLADSGCSLLLCDPDTAASLGPHADAVPTLDTIVSDDEWRTRLADAEARRELPAVDPHAPAGLAYTSGTTGRPKGATHSQHNLLMPGAVLVRSRGYGPALRKGDCLPLTILNMLVLTTLLVAQAEGTAVIMDQLYADGVAEWIERERVTVWNGPPALLHSLAASEHIPSEALGSLEEVWSGGSDLPEALRQRFAERFGRPIIGTYGLSEAPTVVSIDPPDGSHVAGASGKVLPHLDVQVLDDRGERVADGEVGELCLAPVEDGPYAGAYIPLLGYWNRPEATDAVTAGGVVHTGDVGMVDADGWLHVRDRKNLVILRGGANVYPAEVERVLHAIEGVAGSAVAGVPDERLGERVVAAVELDGGAALSADELIERCTTELARYKVPERILLVEELPRNAMGKVDRKAVAALFER